MFVVWPCVVYHQGKLLLTKTRYIGFMRMWEQKTEVEAEGDFDEALAEASSDNCDSDLEPRVAVKDNERHGNVSKAVKGTRTTVKPLDDVVGSDSDSEDERSRRRNVPIRGADPELLASGFRYPSGAMDENGEYLVEPSPSPAKSARSSAPSTLPMGLNSPSVGGRSQGARSVASSASRGAVPKRLARESPAAPGKTLQLLTKKADVKCTLSAFQNEAQGKSSVLSWLKSLMVQNTTRKLVVPAVGQNPEEVDETMEAVMTNLDSFV